VTVILDVESLFAYGTIVTCRTFKQNLIIRVLAPPIIEIEAKNSKRNETNNLVKISVTNITNGDVIKFVSAVWPVCGFIWKLWLPPPIKLTATVLLKYR
jgi:hypothetical protein